MGRLDAIEVRRAYDKFDMLRLRSEPFDEGDMQNIHLWMLAVTRFIEQHEPERPFGWPDDREAVDGSA